jgi:hypothetical protein
MATVAQIAANRQNSLKSTGPVTSQGKLKVSQNAVQHGLTAKESIIYLENQDEFMQYRDSLLNELRPDGAMESVLAERIVSLSWRLKRAGFIQNKTIDALNQRYNCDNFGNLLPRAQDHQQDGQMQAQQELALGNLVIKDCLNARVIERLLIYERRLEHSLYRTILEFQRHKILVRESETEESKQLLPGLPDIQNDRIKNTVDSRQKTVVI